MPLPAAVHNVAVNSSSPLEVAIRNCFLAPNVKAYDEGATDLYKIDEEFQKPYWVENITDRFTTSYRNGILYRHEIVNEICTAVTTNLATIPKRGLMIKGPQGIGKSHSIINVVRKLQSTGNYLVTLIPDCENWQTSFDLVNAICMSIGTTAEVLGIRTFDETPATLLKLIMDITELLKANEKQWVFVFDQINRLFARFPEKKDVGSLPFPFYMIKKIMAVGRVTTIISASANNEISYKDQHTGFTEYLHLTDLSNKEFTILFPGAKLKDRAKHITRNVPLYADEFITNYDEDEEKFAFYWFGCIGASINKLIVMTHVDIKEELYENMIRMLLLLNFDSGAPTVYDRKFFVQIRDESRFQALFPLAESAWRSKIKDKLFEYVNKKEAELLRVYKYNDTTNDTRGRIFESIVIQRCITRGVENFPLSIVTTHETQDETISVPSKHTYFGSQHLPQLTVNNDDDGVHIPINSNFPAVDVVWKSGMYIFGVQIHTSRTHGDIASLFEEKCLNAGWFDTFKDNVFLIYLCPDESCMITSKPNESYHQTTESGRVKIGYITIAQLEFLKNIQLR